MNRDLLAGLLSRVDCVSYTMYSSHVRALQDAFPHLHIPGNLDVSERFNNKAIAAGIYERLAVPAPDTAVTFALADAKSAYQQIKEQYGFPILLKGARGASGFAMRIVRSDDECEAALDELMPYLVEDEYPVKGLTPNNAVGLVVQQYIQNDGHSPGVSVIIGDSPETHTFVGVTDQILDAGCQHVGNVYPLGPYYTPDIHAQVERTMQKLADEALRQGGAGMMLCADFVVAKQTAYIVECNMRLSAQYGGLALAQNLLGTTMPKNGSYFTGTVDGVYRAGETALSADDVFSRLAAEGRLFNIETKSGVIPLNLSISGTVQGVTFADSRDGLRRFGIPI